MYNTEINHAFFENIRSSRARIIVRNTEKRTFSPLPPPTTTAGLEIPVLPIKVVVFVRNKP